MGILSIFTLSCESNEVEEVVLEPSMEMWVNGDPIDPFTYYGSITTFGSKKIGEDGKIKKLLVFHFQREVGRVLPELEHYATIWYDQDATDNDNLIDEGLYLNFGVEDTVGRDKTINLEIIGSLDYTDFGQAEITKVEDNTISGIVNGQFYNPYRDELQIALLIFENIEIGMDPEGTFYTGE
jgi:hypothetical protein|tara:strand:- start:235 stop:780 length:546 start_codon:yes stop_codon:yes gene_type:complete